MGTEPKGRKWGWSLRGERGTEPKGGKGGQSLRGGKGTGHCSLSHRRTEPKEGEKSLREEW